MANFIDNIKQNIASMVTIISFVTIVIGGAIAVEGRYVKAADFVAYKNEQNKSMLTLFQQQRADLLAYQKTQIEDKLFELQLGQKLTPIQKALIQRYQLKLRDVAIELNKTQNLLR